MKQAELDLELKGKSQEAAKATSEKQTAALQEELQTNTLQVAALNAELAALKEATAASKKDLDGQIEDAQGQLAQTKSDLEFKIKVHDQLQNEFDQFKVQSQKGSS